MEGLEYGEFPHSDVGFPKGDSPEEFLANMMTFLKEAAARLENPAPPPVFPPMVMRDLASVQEAVAIEQEIRKGDAGHPTVTARADLLRQDVWDRWRAGQGLAPLREPLTDAIGKLAEVADRQLALLQRAGSAATIHHPTEGVVDRPRLQARRDPPVVLPAQPANDVEPAPLFSQIEDDYLAIRADGGASAGTISTARWRASVFKTLAGNRPLDHYMPIDLQNYVNELQYGSWTTALHKVRMDGADMTMALFIFPRMLHERLAFALARDAAAKGVGEGALTKFEVDQIRWVKSLLDPETGWLTQMPHLAERLVPVTANDGEVIISEADIARVRADWKGACAAARTTYVEMKASNLKHVKVSRDPHESVRPILLMDNPLSALATLCRGLQRDMAGLDPEPLAYASRDAFILGMLAQVGFRKGTVEAMEVDDIFYDEMKGKWCLRVPATRFKSGKAGPYFGTGYGRRHHYERDLMDSHGLYAAIEHYLNAGRRLILGDCETSALFVVSPYEADAIQDGVRTVRAYVQTCRATGRKSC